MLIFEGQASIHWSRLPGHSAPPPPPPAAAPGCPPPPPCSAPAPRPPKNNYRTVLNVLLWLKTSPDCLLGPSINS